MSVKKEYEYRTHTVTEKILIKETMYCDVCSEVINKQGQHWEVTTGHHDWGNDSVDSIENFDICSPSCLREKLNEYILRSGHNDYNSEYFEVKRTW